MTDQPNAEHIARLFHETYERLAPEFSYETRKASAVPWEQVPDNNKRLMVAVAAEVAAALPTPPTEASEEPTVSVEFAQDLEMSRQEKQARIDAALEQIDTELALFGGVHSQSVSGFLRQLQSILTSSPATAGESRDD